MTRRTMLTVGPLGIPVIRDIIIIETEASFSRVLYWMGMIMVYCMVMQSILIVWERWAPRSCRVTVGLILWLFPFALAVAKRRLLFIALWTAYNILLCVLFRHVFIRPIDRGAPRRIYTFFNHFFRLAHVVISMAIIGITATLFMRNALLFNVCLLVFIYFLYYAMLSQEIVVLTSELMALNAGYYTKDHLPQKVLADTLCCALCDQQIGEQSVTLNCNHRYHLCCIKGWFLISKREFCPVCREKVLIENVVDGVVKGEVYFKVFMDVMRKGIVFCMAFVGMVMYKRIF